MSLAEDLDSFFEDDDENIVEDPLRFKAKLGIGERAYWMVRQRENLTTFTEAIGVGSSVSAAASSGLVATTFFAKSGFVAAALSTIGMGATAVTPVGWVIGTGLVFGGAYLGISRIFESPKDSGVVVIPKYINTPLDIIALALVELMLPLSLKIAKADGEIVDSERLAIRDFFVGEWGYSRNFIDKLVEEYEPVLDSVSYSGLTESLNVYCEGSKDCEPGEIAKGLVQHLTRIIEADGTITEAELTELQYIKEILPATDRSSSVREVLDSVGGTVSKGASVTSDTAKSVVGKAGSTASVASKVTAKNAKALTAAATESIGSGAGAVKKSLKILISRSSSESSD